MGLDAPSDGIEVCHAGDVVLPAREEEASTPSDFDSGGLPNVMERLRKGAGARTREATSAVASRHVYEVLGLHL
jgi:hypothetical protein